MVYNNKRKRGLSLSVVYFISYFMKNYLVCDGSVTGAKTYFETFKQAVDFANKRFETEGEQFIYKFDATENCYDHCHSVTFRKVEFDEGVMSYA